MFLLGLLGFSSQKKPETPKKPSLSRSPRLLPGSESVTWDKFDSAYKSLVFLGTVKTSAGRIEIQADSNLNILQSLEIGKDSVYVLRTALMRYDDPISVDCGDGRKIPIARYETLFDLSRLDYYTAVIAIVCSDQDIQYSDHHVLIPF
jgi:hypothetical protein